MRSADEGDKMVNENYCKDETRKYTKKLNEITSTRKY